MQVREVRHVRVLQRRRLLLVELRRVWAQDQQRDRESLELRRPGHGAYTSPPSLLPGPGVGANDIPGAELVRANTTRTLSRS